MARIWISADDYIELAERRRDDCETIAAHARSNGLDVTWERVNRNYRIWKRWREGRISTGHLIRQTGVKRKTHDTHSLCPWWRLGTIGY